ncbi:MAG: DUF6531 domain-containing protein [Gammaproteobacteria bacterium]
MRLADDMPLAITRTYRPGDTVVRAFGKGTNHSYGLYVRTPTGSYDELDLVLPDGGSRRSPDGMKWNPENSKGAALLERRSRMVKPPSAGVGTHSVRYDYA